MVNNCKEIKELYYELSDVQKMELWKCFSTYLNDFELKRCIDEVQKGFRDLFDIHNENGYIDKYQIYFSQTLEKITNRGVQNGRDS